MPTSDADMLFCRRAAASAMRRQTNYRDRLISAGMTPVPHGRLSARRRFRCLFGVYAGSRNVKRKFTIILRDCGKRYFPP
jgi:hypothetical protein